MRLFELRLHLIAPLAVVFCLIGVGSQPAQAQSATNTLFVANTTCSACLAVPPVGLVPGVGTAVPSSDSFTGLPVTLNDTTYGPVKFGGGNGGPTGWIHVTYTIPEETPTGNYTLLFQVSNAGDESVPSALAIDNIVSPHFAESFEGGIPANWKLSGGAPGYPGLTGGTSSAITNLAPTNGTLFAWITNGCQAGCNNTLGSVSAAYGSLYQGPGTNGLPEEQGLGIPTVGTTLQSPEFTLAAGDTISFDVNFLTADGTYNFSDFATAQLVLTPADSMIISFSPSATPETQIATIGNPTDPAAQSLALTLASVTNAINVSVSFFYEPTDVSNNFHPGIGVADGVCENGATEETDFDCRLTDFTYPAPTLPAGDRLVSHCIPSHNNLCVWVRVIATLVSNGMPAVAGTDYNRNGGDVEWAYAWNANPQLFSPTPNPNYSPGWNNLNPQMYDRPGSNPDIAFIFNITTFSKFNCNPTCVGTADPVTGGKTLTLNDIVVAAPPNPSTGSPDTVELLVPVPGSSPFQYLKSLPMLVSFELENESSEKSDPTALTPPHSVSVATLDPNGNPIPVQYPARFPTTFTYSSFFKTYYIFLSPAPYTVGTVYTLQIDSDLFPQPVNQKFVVKNFQF